MYRQLYIFKCSSISLSKRITLNTREYSSNLLHFLLLTAKVPILRDQTQSSISSTPTKHQRCKTTYSQVPCHLTMKQKMMNWILDLFAHAAVIRQEKTSAAHIIGHDLPIKAIILCLTTGYVNLLLPQNGPASPNFLSKYPMNKPTFTCTEK